MAEKELKIQNLLAGQAAYEHASKNKKKEIPQESPVKMSTSIRIILTTVSKNLVKSNEYQD